MKVAAGASDILAILKLKFNLPKNGEFFGSGNQTDISFDALMRYLLAVAW